jgi:hypothetical protein
MDLEHEKKALIKKVREEYISSVEKYRSVTFTITYTELGKLNHENILPAVTSKPVILKKSKTYYLLFFILSSVMLFYGIYPYLVHVKIVGDERSPHLFFGPLGIVITCIAYLRRKILLILDANGIFYYQWDDYIKWKNVLLVFIKEKKSDDTEVAPSSKEMIIHFYSDKYHIIMSETISIKDMDVDVSMLNTNVSAYMQR